MEEIQTHGSKFQRIGSGNGRIESNKIGQQGDETYPDDEDDGEIKRLRCGGGGNTINIGGGVGGVAVHRLYGGWPSSRIVRVSRASGGKDRHSKVLTSKGLRDRRVRLSVNTAIQFYDLQDRLGYDQPSKAVEWLLKAAASSIDELPPINNTFPDTPKQLSDEKRSSADAEHGFDSAKMELDKDPNFQQHVSLSKSTCSSTSETSKGSGLSLSRSENRIKARERARDRTAEKEKEKENETQVAQPQNLNPITQSSSFTELLTGGIGSVSTSSTPSVHPKSAGAVEGVNLFQKSPRQWVSPPLDYFSTGLLASSSRSQHSSSGLSAAQILWGNSFPQSMTVSPFHVVGDQHQEMQHYTFVPDNLVPVVTSASANNAEYDLNFTISSSSSLAGFNNRGTLQSNSPSLLPHLQRFPPIDGSGFFIGAAAAPNNNAAAPVESHHHPFQPGFDAHLQLSYGDGGRPSDQKCKGKH